MGHGVAHGERRSPKAAGWAVVAAAKHILKSIINIVAALLPTARTNAEQS